MDKPSGGFFKGGRGGKARDQLWLRALPPGRDSPPRPARRRSLSLGYPAARVALRFPVLPPSPGGGNGARGGSGGERRPNLRRSSARDGLPSRASTQTRRGQCGPVPGTLTSARGTGKLPRDLPGSGNIGFRAPGAGFPALARPPNEPPVRAPRHRVRLSGPVPESPGASRSDLPSPI